MASMLDLFCLLSGIDVSYKKVERLYSNYDVSWQFQPASIDYEGEGGEEN